MFRDGDRLIVIIAIIDVNFILIFRSTATFVLFQCCVRRRGNETNCLNKIKNLINNNYIILASKSNFTFEIPSQLKYLLDLPQHLVRLAFLQLFVPKFASRFHRRLLLVVPNQRLSQLVRHSDKFIKKNQIINFSFK